MGFNFNYNYHPVEGATHTDFELKAGFRLGW